MNQWKIILTDNTGGDYYPADEVVAENISHHGYAIRMAEALNRGPEGRTYFKVVPQEQPLRPGCSFEP